MTSISLPAVVPGAIILSGVVKKQPHGMFAAIRGKQLRFMELKVLHDLVPVLTYYDHPKSDASVPKGVMHLNQYINDSENEVWKIKHDGERMEIELCVQQVPGQDGRDVHVVSDLLIALETSSEFDKWVAALNHALVLNIDNQSPETIAFMKLSQVMHLSLLKLRAVLFTRD
jgi:hypothetical protein